VNCDNGLAFCANFTSTALSTAGAHDLVSLVSSANARCELVEIALAQATSAPVSFGVEIWRGSTSAPGGSAIVPTPLPGWPAERAAASGCNANASATMSTASAVRLYSGAFENDSGKFVYRPDPAPTLALNQRLHVRLGTPPSAVPVAVSLTFKETGKIPG
jgi:hypothetical protein